MPWPHLLSHLIVGSVGQPLSRVGWLVPQLSSPDWTCWSICLSLGHFALSRLVLWFVGLSVCPFVVQSIGWSPLSVDPLVDLFGLQSVCSLSLVGWPFSQCHGTMVGLSLGSLIL